MALIGSIRKRSWILVAGVGVAMLLFILGDFTRCIGTDRPVRAEAYESPVIDDELESELRSYSQFMPFANSPESDRLMWKEFLKEYLFSQEYDKVGVGEVTKEEFSDFMIYNPSPEILQDQNFRGADGRFHPDTMRARLTNMESAFDQRVQALQDQMNTAPDNEKRLYQQEIDKTREMQGNWENYKRYLKWKRRRSKYVGLIESSYYATTLEGKVNHANNMDKRTIRVLYKPFASITDEASEVSDDELMAYYNEHKSDKIWEQPESRLLSYFKVEVPMSEEDKRKHENKMNSLKAEFEDPATDDSAFVLRESFEVRTLNPQSPQIMDQVRNLYNGEVNPVLLPTGLDTAQLNSAPVGTVFGPYTTLDNSTRQSVSKLIKKVSNTTTDSVRVRHILIGVGGDKGQDDASAAATADSVIDLLKGGADFAQLAIELSDDEDTAGMPNNDGYYTFNRTSPFVQPFKDFGFNTEEGDIDKVRSQFGYHVMENMNIYTSQKARIATVVVPREPSASSVNDTKEMLSDLSFEMDGENFSKIASDSGYTVVDNHRIEEDGFINISDLSERSMEIKKFAFGPKGKEGNVSDPVRAGNSFYLFQVATVQHKDEEPQFAMVKEAMRPLAEGQKKAELYVDQLNGKTDINEAAKIMGVSPINSTVSFSAATIPSAGTAREYEIVGRIFGVSEGEFGTLQGPWVGKSGVFMVAVDKETKDESEFDMAQERETVLRNSRPYNLEDQLFKALSELAELKDYYWEGSKSEE